MANSSQIKLFQNYNLQDLFKQVVSNSRQNRKNIKQSIQLVADQVQTITDVQIMSPQIVSYLNIMVKNDQLLIKLSQTATRLMDQKLNIVDQTTSGLSQQERRHLIQQANKQIQPIIRESRKYKQDAKKIV